MLRPGLAVAPVKHQQVLDALSWLLSQTRPDWLGKGRDSRSVRPYTRLVLHSAWSVTNNVKSMKYAAAQMELANKVAAGAELFPKEEVATEPLWEKLEKTPAPLVNEAILLHGTKPDNCLSMLADGLNARLSGGLFGNGIYLAEDCGKCDQYCTPHVPGEHPELAGHLFPDGHRSPVHYVFVCSALLGHTVHSADGEKGGAEGAVDLHDVWASAERKELAMIPGSQPAAPFNSLVVDLGKKIVRYREFVTMHNSRIRTDFLVAYTRE